MAKGHFVYPSKYLFGALEEIIKEVLLFQFLGSISAGLLSLVYQRGVLC